LSFTLAVAGKGGSGKTSVSALIIRHLIKNNKVPIMVVDADPNANLGESLGIKVEDTVGTMLDKFQKEKIDIPPGMTKEAYLEFKMNSLVAESKYFDLISMGRGPGQDCYCYPNTILRKFIDNMHDNYKYTVMDNEAGMEHLSRGTTQDVDELLIISNHSVKGVRTIARIQELVVELKLRVKHQSIIINMCPPEVDHQLLDELSKLGIKPDAFIPYDENIYKFDLIQKSLVEMEDNSPAVQAVDKLMSDILSIKTAV